jgi:hypothetical protein
MRLIPDIEVLPPLVQLTNHVKENAKQAVIPAPTKVNAVNCGAFGGIAGTSRDCPAPTGAWKTRELRSWEATMIYRNRSRNFAFSELPSFEVTTLWTMQ